ncbi:hypothetical protein PIB30_088597 [Stylosanthes scabra]|uniref:Uncharacterized protein n=1 Tax=Stylosanthes scabra TaxID=79078 RepID=A0ABU6RU31_9FABA|nr:hypothetical protein [Stylosanthes scabra]
MSQAKRDFKSKIQGFPNSNSVNPRGNDTLLTYYYLIRSGALAGGLPNFRKDFGASSFWRRCRGLARLIERCKLGNKDKQTLSFDPEIEKTLRKLRKQAKLQEHSHEIPFEEALEEEFEEKTGDNMAGNEDNNRGRKLADFSIPSAASCGSSVVRPAVDVNNFELKPSLIQLVQQD